MTPETSRQLVERLAQQTNCLDDFPHELCAAFARELAEHLDAKAADTDAGERAGLQEAAEHLRNIATELDHGT